MELIILCTYSLQYIIKYFINISFYLQRETLFFDDDDDDDDIITFLHLDHFVPEKEKP